MKNYYNKVQAGITTRCNSVCVGCIRNRKTFDKVDLPIDVLDKIFEFKIHTLLLIGTRGDALFHPDFRDIILSCQEKVTDSLVIGTNGSGFNEEWWYDLAKNTNDKVKIIFALDGIDNKTHSKYRPTDFDKVYRNMKAFIKGGGHAIWQYIVFRHNERYIPIAKELSKLTGCSSILLQRSFYYDENLRPPLFSKKKDSTTKKFTCEFLQNRKVYVSADGFLFPCCYMPSSFYMGWNKRFSGPILDLYKNQTKTLNNDSFKNLINNSEFFNHFKNYKKERFCIWSCKSSSCWVNNKRIEK
jgi:MoaA/NifB/PqqE/SkfB family radical SAM enzyme